MKMNDAKSGRPSPMRAILWKEMRRSAWLLLSLLLAPFIAPFGHLRIIWVVQGILATMLGARCFAEESASGTAFFQWERPVRRGRIWAAHMVLPGIALAASFLVRVLFEVLGRDLPGMVAANELTIGGICLLIAFAATVLTGVVLDRPVTALAAGVVLFVLVGFLMLGFADLVFDRLAPDMPNGWQLFIGASVAVLIGVALLLLSRWAYVRQERE